ncbi:DUF4082 domain-containing protein [Fibrivirga algicola]|uniref:DUF4082 domain-containing protein n=1 Tax=Fibrivirga algicola TaxID=2950420 RepID=A0ABX0QE46_9BACT|nr:DUF4082 domain-containing protein [Fibrivirga algicola]NID10689.1 DUF4082 domain-containing protein [Fibrivirga algicola]
MKKTLIVGLMMSVATLTGCSKKDTVKPGENSVTAFITENTLTPGTRTSGPWELGIVFSASVAGKITEVGSKMPEPGSYRVIVWDFDTKQVLRQKTIEQTSPDKLTLNGIDALALTANKKYVISVNNQSDGVNKKYAFTAKTGGADFMPFTKGSILVYNSCYRNTATPLFPDVVSNVKYELYGYPEFTFVPD